MRKFYYSLAIVALAATSCQQEVVFSDTPKEPHSIELAESATTRSYDEALEVAEEALKLLDGDNTRTSHSRVIKRNEGQTVMRPVTRGGETAEEPIMYVFNNENDEGFVIVAANKSVQPLIAVTEKGNYTYGEPTGVEPFDLLMEDVVTGLSVIEPDLDPIIRTERENELFDPQGPYSPIQWGTGTIYGSMYPDGIAYDEATAIAQGLMCSMIDAEYTITNPNDALYGQTIAFDKGSMDTHVRNDYHGFLFNTCTDDTHNQISRLFLEIGYRLSNGTNISLSNKLSPFTLTKVRSVLESFGAEVGEITAVPLANPYINIIDRDVYVFRGTYDDPLSILPGAHTWVATGLNEHTYDRVVYMPNYMIDPNHPNPNEYTETSREQIVEYLYYMNWGYDGYSNGWFISGCFDMSQRDSYTNTSIPIGGLKPTLDYNFVNVEVMTINNPAIVIN